MIQWAWLLVKRRYWSSSCCFNSWQKAHDRTKYELDNVHNSLLSLHIARLVLVRISQINLKYMKSFTLLGITCFIYVWTMSQLDEWSGTRGVKPSHFVLIFLILHESRAKLYYCDHDLPLHSTFWQHNSKFLWYDLPVRVNKFATFFKALPARTPKLTTLVESWHSDAIMCCSTKGTLWMSHTVDGDSNKPAINECQNAC